MPYSAAVAAPAAVTVRARVVAGLGTVALLAAADVAADPVHRHVPLCPLHAMTGSWCPLCGSLRAVDELLHARLGAAARDNLLLLVATPVVALVWFGWASRPVDQRVRRGRARVMWAGVIAAAVIFTVLRNLPFARALRPG